MTQAASVSSLMFAGIMFGSPLIGYLADKFGRKIILVAGYAGLLAGIMTLFFVNDLSMNVTTWLFLGLGIASCTQNLI
jgi:MFS family permease